MKKYDEKYLRISFDVALEALSKGNHPFGAVLVDKNGEEFCAPETPSRTTAIRQRTPKQI